MASLSFHSKSPEDTQRLGRLIGELAGPGDIVFLSGPLGAGKTCLAQGIAYGLGIKDGTASPSYVLMREFKGRLPLYHMDLYRLNVAEVDELGLDEYLFGRGVSVIEWAEKAENLMPEEHLDVILSYEGDSHRSIEIVPHGAKYDELVKDLKDKLAKFATGSPECT
jgi:tRNA threonylcarbamoyladenosine biosynthesis protein TsaE